MEKEIKGMYHTHTKYSKLNHGKNTVGQMVEKAKSLGIEEYGISDHGPRHIFGILKSKIKNLRNDVNEASKKYEQKVVVGLEFNLLGNNGETDYSSKMDKYLDIKLLGAHAGAISIKSFFSFYLPNILNKNSEKRRQKNTDSYIRAIEKNHFDIITHPNEFINVDLLRLAEACVKNNCYLELNEKHMNLTREDIEKVKATGVKFMIGSDAHSTERILDVSRVLSLIEECGLDQTNVANLNGLPNFKNKYQSE